MFHRPSQLTRTITLLAACAGLTLTTATADPSPGETSGAPLAPLVVAEYDKTSGNMRLAYQSACGATDNNIYYGPLSQVSSLGWSGSVCGIGTGGSYSGFNPGPGSYFFLIVGNDGEREGSYGRSTQGGTSAERPSYAGNACGQTQQLTGACTPAPTGGACGQSTDCGPRQTCLENASGVAECVCLDPFTGAFCESCAPGHAGVDCRECAAGFISNSMELASVSDGSEDLTDPVRLRCVPDIIASCEDVDCSAHGSCEIIGRNAFCACDAGHTGRDCGECVPNYELSATGTCVLGDICRAPSAAATGTVSTPRSGTSPAPATPATAVRIAAARPWRSARAARRSASTTARASSSSRRAAPARSPGKWSRVPQPSPHAAFVIPAVHRAAPG